MKISEVSRRTGLTKRTIRYYLEQGLIAPRIYEKNGKEYRDYDVRDLQLLEAIASLRRAGFSVEQIRMVQQHPESIPELWAAYIRMLKEASVRLNALLEAAKQAEPSELVDLYAMSRVLEPAARQMPLPQRDAQPHFRHLDELPVSRESQERDRMQYAKTRYVSPPNLHASPYMAMRGGVDVSAFALGERYFEHMPIKNKRTQAVLLVILVALTLVILGIPVSRHIYDRYVFSGPLMRLYNLDGYVYIGDDDPVSLPRGYEKSGIVLYADEGDGTVAWTTEEELVYEGVFIKGDEPGRKVYVFAERLSDGSKLYYEFRRQGPYMA